jgi:hypothetical protein
MANTFMCHRQVAFRSRGFVILLMFGIKVAQVENTCLTIRMITALLIFRLLTSNNGLMGILEFRAPRFDIPILTTVAAINGGAGVLS